MFIQRGGSLPLRAHAVGRYPLSWPQTPARNARLHLLKLDWAEREWFEFKENWFDQTQLGQYISALSNSAAIEGRKNAYFVWGIHNDTHAVTGTTFNSNMDIKNEPLKHFLARQVSPDLNFTFEETIYEGKKVVVLTIPAAKTFPTSFDNERFIRIGSSKESLRKHPEKESYLFDVLRHGFPTIENTPSKYQELTFEKLMIYYGAKGLKLNPDTFIKKLKSSYGRRKI